MSCFSPWIQPSLSMTIIPWNKSACLTLHGETSIGKSSAHLLLPHIYLHPFLQPQLSWPSPRTHPRPEQSVLLPHSQYPFFQPNLIQVNNAFPVPYHTDLCSPVPYPPSFFKQQQNNSLTYPTPEKKNHTAKVNIWAVCLLPISSLKVNTVTLLCEVPMTVQGVSDWVSW